MPIIVPSTSTPYVTSGTYVFTVTRDTVIRQAMLDIGKLDENEAPSAQDTADCATVLNMMVKQWKGKSDFAPGLKTWTRRRGYLFLNGSTGQYTVGPGGAGWTNAFTSATTTAAAAPAATALAVPAGLTGVAATYNVGVQLDSGALFWTTVLSYVGTVLTLNAGLPSTASANSVVYVYQTAGTQPVQIETALLRDNENNDVPLTFLTVQDYDLLPQKANPQNQSDPTGVYYEFHLTNSYLFTDVGAAADVTKYIVTTYMEEIQDFNNPLDNPEYPAEWFLPLCLGLGKLICPMYNGTWTPLLQDNYTSSLAIAQHKGVEVRTDYFQPGID